MVKRNGLYREIEIKYAEKKAEEVKNGEEVVVDTLVELIIVLNRIHQAKGNILVGSTENPGLNVSIFSDEEMNILNID